MANEIRGGTISIFLRQLRHHLELYYGQSKRRWDNSNLHNLGRGCAGMMKKKWKRVVFTKGELFILLLLY